MKKPEPKKQPLLKGKVSREDLYHFRCAACEKWWSIAGAQKTKKEWFCPWCGEEQQFKLLKSSFPLL